MIKLRKGKTTKRGTSLYLDIHHEGRRWSEFLKLYLPKDRIKAAQVMDIAESIRAKKERDLILQGWGVAEKQADLLPMFDKYQHLQHYKVFKACKAKLEKFSSNPLPCNRVTEQFCIDFRSSLESMHGETPYNYFRVFKRVLKDATRAGYYLRNPAEYVRNPNPTRYDLKKEVLTVAEVKKLFEVVNRASHSELAFLFSISTGLRYVNLQRPYIYDRVARTITFMQAKRKSQHVVPLNENAIKILELVGGQFVLPSTNSANENIGRLAKRAGISKHITSGSARHTFVTSVLRYTGNMKLAGKIAGHSSIAMTEKYAHILDEETKAAVKGIEVEW
jgi:integrase/recombinase XerD